VSRAARQRAGLPCNRPQSGYPRSSGRGRVIDQQSASFAPVADSERIVTLDFIRGLALLGILFCNITDYAQPSLAYNWPRAIVGGMTPADQAVWLFQFALIDAKFRGLFTLLFGAGMFLFHERSLARGEGRWRLARRLLVLLGFGLVHYFLIWRGDILTLYATWGLAALLCIRWNKTRQFAVGLTLAAVGSLMTPLMIGMMWSRQHGNLSPEAEALRDAAGELQLYTHGSYPQIVADAVTRHGGDLLRELGFVGIFETSGLILLGMAFYRMGLFTGAVDATKLWRRGWIAVAVGVALALLAGLWPLVNGFPRMMTMFTFIGLGALPHLITLLGLVAVLAAWAPRASKDWLGRRLAATGRMAFSNYLGMSVVMMFVFHGWALGLYGRFHRLELLGFVLAGWVLMLAWSPWWLAHFRYGPLEWVWRSLTYGRLFAFRRARPTREAIAQA
jgi:uncharacterized protein